MSSLDLKDFIYIEGGRHLLGGGFTRNEWMTIDQISEYRTKSGNVGVYTTAYIYDSQDIKESNLYGDFYLDFDNEEDFEAVRKSVKDAVFYFARPFFYNIPKRFIRCYFSGKKGVHMIIPATCFGIEPSKHLNQYYKQLAVEATQMVTGDKSAIDTKIYDNRRLFRLPNSRHQDTGLYKIPLTVEELMTMPYEGIKELAKSPRQMRWERPYEIAQAKSQFLSVIERWKKRWEDKFNRQRKADAKPFDFIPPCIQELLDTGPKKGQRNNTVAALASFFKRQGHSEEEIWDQLLIWNNDSLPEVELRAVIKSIFSGDYEYGCSTFEVLSTCYGKECRLYKGEA